ncbi:MAG: alpha/beta fold hydrolase [Pseudomonadales bacterium]
MPRLETHPLSLEYAVTGPDHGTPIVLIRGLGTQMIEWSPVLLSSLAESGFRVIVFDNRDVGLSDKAPADYTMTDMAEDVVRLLDGLGVARAVIFGISMGGMIAQHLAFAHPDRIIALFPVMTSSGAPDLPRPTAEVFARLSTTGADRASSIALTAENRAVFGSPDWPEPLVTRLAAAALAYDRCHYPAGVARQMRAVVADGSRVDRLRRVTVPTCVIHGIDDPLVPFAAGAHVAACVPGARLEAIPGMGHNLPDGLLPRIVGIVRDFVSGL